MTSNEYQYALTVSETAGLATAAGGYSLVFGSASAAGGTTASVYRSSSVGGGANQKKRVGIGLYFRFVKSKLKKHEQEKAKAQLQKLRKMLAAVDEADQRALYEELSKRFVKVVRDIEAAAAGYDQYVMTDDVNRFIRYVGPPEGYPSDSDLDRVVRLDALKDYPRPIPKGPSAKLKRAKTLGLFDEYYVLHISYGPKMKTTKEKIREKDPILFGSISGDDRLYFIADWIDEHCDLTFDKMVSTIKEKEIDFDAKKLEEMDESFIEKLKADGRERERLLDETKMSTWRQTEAAAAQLEKKPAEKVGFWKRVWRAARGTT